MGKATSRSAWWAAMAWALVVGGCQKDCINEPPPVAAPAPSAEPVPSSEPAPSASAPAVAVAVDAPMELKLIDSGAEPRKPLRYKFHLGQAETLEMDMRLAMGMEVGLNKQPETPTPGMRLQVVMTPKALTEAGDLRYTFRLQAVEVLQDPTIPPQMLVAAEAQLTPLTGLTGEAVIDVRGITKEASFVPPPGMSPSLQPVMDNLRYSLRNVASPLPEEAVGRGARWEITTPLNTPGLKLTQISTHTLESLTGDTAKVQLSLRQEAPRQPVTIPGSRDGSTASLESLSSSGTGSMAFDLNRIVPQSKLTMTSESTIKAQDQGTAKTIKMTVRLQIETRRK